MSSFAQSFQNINNLEHKGELEIAFMNYCLNDDKKLTCCFPKKVSIFYDICQNPFKTLSSMQLRLTKTIL